MQVQEGAIDPVVGRTMRRFPSRAGAQHKTPGAGRHRAQGAPDLVSGPGTSTLQALRPAQSIFDGIDTTVPGLAKLAGLPDGTIRAELAAMDAAAKKALSDYEPLDPVRIIPALADGLRATRAARASLKSSTAATDARADADFLLTFKERDSRRTRARGRRVVDPIADRENVVQVLRLSVGEDVLPRAPTEARRRVRTAPSG